MKTSPAGRVLILEREGRRLTAYRDSRGIWTIGVGHTGRMSPPVVTEGMTINEAQCDEMLARDLAPVEAVIASVVKVPLSQNEFDAMASLGFNIGAAGLRGSTVIRKLNLGDVDGAAQAFMLWSRPATLQGRRALERAQFLQSDSSNAVATARARTLSAAAATTKRQAIITRNAGGAFALVGAMTAAGTAHANHSSIARLLAVFVLLGAVVDGLVAWWHQTRAAALSAHVSK